MTELRWIVPADTTTEGPLLQVWAEDGWGNRYWQTVPRVVVSSGVFAEAALRKVAEVIAPTTVGSVVPRPGLEPG